MDDICIHVNDWIASETVALLGLTGEAIYLRLLMHQWKNEADGLPQHPELLRRLTGATPKEWKSAWSLIERHVPVCPDGRRRNDRLENERLYYLGRREKRSAAGKKGNDVRWDRDGDSPPDGPDSDGNGIAMRSPKPRNPVAPSLQNDRPSPSPSQNYSSTAVQQLSDSTAVVHQSREATAGILPIGTLADRVMARVEKARR